MTFPRSCSEPIDNSSQIPDFQWQEEFEDEIDFISDGYQSGMFLRYKNDLGENQYVADWIEKYLGTGIVKVKCKDGLIQIERVE